MLIQVLSMEFTNVIFEFFLLRYIYLLWRQFWPTRKSFHSPVDLAINSSWKGQSNQIMVRLQLFSSNTSLTGDWTSYSPGTWGGNQGALWKLRYSYYPFNWVSSWTIRGGNPGAPCSFMKNSEMNQETVIFLLHNRFSGSFTI